MLDFILPLAEGLRGEYGNLVWVFAGYKKDMDKLFEHNPGMPSRFPLHFKFEDYSDHELLSIFQSLLEPPPPPPPKPADSGNFPKPPPPPAGMSGRPSYGGYSVGHRYTDTHGNMWEYNGAAWYDR